MLSENLLPYKNSEVACDRWIWTIFIEVGCQSELSPLNLQTKTKPLITLYIASRVKQIQHLKSCIQFNTIINFWLVLKNRHYIIRWITFNIDPRGTKKE